MGPTKNVFTSVCQVTLLMCSLTLLSSCEDSEFFEKLVENANLEQTDPPSDKFPDKDGEDSSEIPKDKDNERSPDNTDNSDDNQNDEGEDGEEPCSENCGNNDEGDDRDEGDGPCVENCGNDDEGDDGEQPCTENCGNDDGGDDGEQPCTENCGNDDEGDDGEQPCTENCGNDDEGDDGEQPCTENCGNDDEGDDGEQPCTENCGNDDEGDDGEQPCTENCDDGPVLNSITETFIQTEASNSKIDILWVIDDSGSMGPDQANLAYNFDAFINEFISKGLDYRMAITTTDTRPPNNSNFWWLTGGYEGRMVCDYQLISAPLAQVDPNAVIDNFIDCAMVGTNGSGHETGLEAIEFFIGHNGPSAPEEDRFIRDDAYFITIILADEDDQSPRNTGVHHTLPVDHYLDIMFDIKDNNGLVKVYSIVFMHEDQREHAVESIGYRFMEASEKTGGQVANIKDNFYDILSDISGDIVELADSFPLSQTPSDGLTVEVNGLVVPSSHYSVNLNNRTLRFNEGFIPSAGSEIIVSYQYE